MFQLSRWLGRSEETATPVTLMAVGAPETKMNLKMKEAIQLLDGVLSFPEALDEEIPKLQEAIWDDDSEEETPVLEILRDLAYDLEYYVSDPDNRREDPSYFGSDKALEEIETARKKLMAL